MRSTYWDYLVGTQKDSNPGEVIEACHKRHDASADAPIVISGAPAGGAWGACLLTSGCRLIQMSWKSGSSKGGGRIDDRRDKLLVAWLSSFR